MELLSKLKLPLEKPFIFTLGGTAAIGKTTVLTIIAAELAKLGNSILFVSEDRSKNVMKRFVNLGLDNKSNITVMGIHNIDKKINEYIGGRNFDYVFFDSPVYNSDKFYYEMGELLNNQNISFFVSAQLKRDAILNKISLNTKPLQISDFVVFILRRKPNFFDKIKKLFGIKINNITFAFTKNRYDRESTFNYNIDFQNINK